MKNSGSYTRAITVVVTAFAHRTLVGLTLLSCVVPRALSVALEGLNVTENGKKSMENKYIIIVKRKTC